MASDEKFVQLSGFDPPVLIALGLMMSKFVEGDLSRIPEVLLEFQIALDENGGSFPKANQRTKALFEFLAVEYYMSRMNKRPSDVSELGKIYEGVGECLEESIAAALLMLFDKHAVVVTGEVPDTVPDEWLD